MIGDRAVEPQYRQIFGRKTKLIPGPDFRPDDRCPHTPSPVLRTGVCNGAYTNGVRAVSSSQHNGRSDRHAATVMHAIRVERHRPGPGRELTAHDRSSCWCHSYHSGHRSRDCHRQAN